MAKHILVTGATGQQGGAVVDALLAKGHHVRGLTRRVDSPAAKALADRGVELAAGDFNHPEALRQAATGVDAIFAMTTPFEAGMEAETAQGIAAIQAAKDAGVKHFVYSSVSDADRATGIPHFDSKYKVEEALAASGLRYSIVAPVFFMDNLLAPWMLPQLAQGALSLAMPGERVLQHVSVRNIGQFAAAVIERGDALHGQRFNLAGDALSGEAAAQVVSEAAGRPIAYQGFPPAAMREQSEDMALMFEWFDAVGYSADIAKLRADFPEVSWQTFAEWAGEQDWASLLAVPA